MLGDLDAEVPDEGHRNASSPWRSRRSRRSAFRPPGILNPTRPRHSATLEAGVAGAAVLEEGLDRAAAGPRSRTASADSVRIASSAAGMPPSRKRRRTCLVIAWALVGPAASSAARARERGLELLLGEDRVDDAPALQLLGAEELAGHHELAGAAAAGALGEALGAAHRRRQPDHFLDQAELRLRRGDDQVAAERDLEGRGQGQRVGGEDDRRRQRLELVDRPQQLVPERRSPAPG